MAAKKPKPKPKVKPKPAQEPRLIQAGHAAETDEISETFAHILVKIVRHRIAATGK
jgi:hypothetical protein